jgi:hypothetical protein
VDYPYVWCCSACRLRWRVSALGARPRREESRMTYRPTAYRPRPRAPTSTPFLLSPLIWILPPPQWPIESRPRYGESQFGALRSSADVVHGSLESSKTLADLIDVLGLDNHSAEGQGLSNKASDGSKNTSDAPLHPPKNDAILHSQRPGTPPAGPFLLLSPTTPKGPRCRRPTDRVSIAQTHSPNPLCPLSTKD